jgi:hypothetical protein
VQVLRSQIPSGSGERQYRSDSDYLGFCAAAGRQNGSAAGDGADDAPKNRYAHYGTSGFERRRSSYQIKAVVKNAFSMHICPAISAIHKEQIDEGYS